MKGIKILIIEDEVLIAEHMKYYLTGFGFSHIFLAHSKKTALEMIGHIEPDIVLLDLHLQEPKDGIEIARVIDDNVGPPYIFITANVDMLILQEATHTKASGYITKPVKKADLFAAIQIALHAKEKPENSFLLIKESNTNLKIRYDDILYLEGNSNYINIVTKTHKAVARKSLEWAELELPENLFMRIHRSYIVNLIAVQRTNAKSVFIGEIEIPISRANLTKMVDFLKKKDKS